MILHDGWNSFICDIVGIMEKFRDEEIEIFEAFTLTEKSVSESRTQIDPNILEFIDNSISEIGADINEYNRLFDFLKSKPDKEELMKYMNEDD